MIIFSKLKKILLKIKSGDLRYWFVKRKFLKLRKKRSFSKKYKFINRQLGTKKLILILAGFQPYYWDMMTANINNSNYDRSDVCICIPKGEDKDGKTLIKLYEIAQKFNWSVCFIKQDKLSLVQNLAIKLHPNAEVIYKFDEDIMIPINYFYQMDNARELILAEKKYDAGMIVPIINVNLATMTYFNDAIGGDFDKKFDLRELGLRGIHKSKDAGLYLTKLIGKSINCCSEKISNFNKHKYIALPIRYSIGAISFSRSFWEEIGYFVVEDYGTLGAEEEQVCAYCMNESKPCICAMDCFVAHLGYFYQKEVCKEYFLNHTEYFDNSIV